MITLYTAVSLDGYVAGEGDDLGWLEAAGKGGADGDYGYERFFATVDVTVMGRGTWEVVRDFQPWPYRGKPCVVLTRRRGLAPVANETFEMFDAERWRERSRREHVYLCGGGEAVRLFLSHRLVDRMDLATIPVLLGRGKPLFPPGFPGSRWRLRASEGHASGVVSTSWERR